MPKPFARYFLLYAVFQLMLITRVDAFQMPDSVEIDLRNEWLIYNARVGTYGPYIESTGFTGNTISLVLKNESFTNDRLILCLQEGTSLFIEQKIVAYYANAGCRQLDLDSLFTIYEMENLFLTLYNPSLDIDKIQTFAASKSNLQEAELRATGQRINLRNFNGFKNFYTLALIILLAFLSFVYQLNPKNFRQFWSLSKVFDFKLTYDKIHGLRVMSWSNLLILFAHCLLVAYLLIVVFHLLGDPLTFLKTNINSTFLGIWRWLYLSLAILVTVFLKYLLIKILAGMMQLKELDNVHFYFRVLSASFRWN